MAEGEVENTEEGEGEVKAGGGKKKLIIIVAAALVLLGGGGGAAAFFLGVFDSAPADEEASAQDDHGDGHEEDAGAHGADQAAEDGHDSGGSSEMAHGEAGELPSNEIVFVAMPDVLVNLESSGKRMRFLKLKAALETANAEVAARVEALMPRIMDSFQLYLRALSIDEVKGSAGLAQLKDELMARVNHAVHPARVDDILVKEMLVQ